MRRIFTLLLALLLLASCSDNDEDEGAGFGAELPEFADGGEVNQGDIAQRGADATFASLAVAGESIALTGAVCLAPELDLPGGFGFQAALVDREGSLSVDVEPVSGTTEIDLFLDGEMVTTSGATAEFRDGIWQVRSEAEVPDGPEIPGVLVSFSCPGPLEERIPDETGVPDVTPDPARSGG